MTTPMEAAEPAPSIDPYDDVVSQRRVDHGDPHRRPRRATRRACASTYRLFSRFSRRASLSANVPMPCRTNATGSTGSVQPIEEGLDHGERVVDAQSPNVDRVVARSSRGCVRAASAARARLERAGVGSSGSRFGRAPTTRTSATPTVSLIGPAATRTRPRRGVSTTSASVRNRSTPHARPGASRSSVAGWPRGSSAASAAMCSAARCAASAATRRRLRTSASSSLVRASNRSARVADLVVELERDRSAGAPRRPRPRLEADRATLRSRGRARRASRAALPPDARASGVPRPACASRERAHARARRRFAPLRAVGGAPSRRRPAACRSAQRPRARSTDRDVRHEPKRRLHSLDVESNRSVAQPTVRRRHRLERFVVRRHRDRGAPLAERVDDCARRALRPRPGRCRPRARRAGRACPFASARGSARCWRRAAENVERFLAID